MQNFMYIASYFCKILNKILTLKTVCSKKGYYKILPTLHSGGADLFQTYKRTGQQTGMQAVRHDMTNSRF